MFEKILLEMCQYMTIKACGKIVRETDMRIWRVIHFHTTKARKFENYCGVKYIGIDDKSYKKNHKYATIIVDVEKKKVISVIKGRDYNAMKEFVDDFILHGGVADNIQISTCDMSLVFRKSLKYYFKNTKIIIDKFHVFKHLNDAVNDTRRMESKDNKSLKRSRYLFLKSELSLNEKQILKRDILLNLNPLTNSAYSCKLELEKYIIIVKLILKHILNSFH